MRVPPTTRTPPGRDEAAQGAWGGGASAPRKKGVDLRAWLSLDQSGQASTLEAGKHVIMRRTGLPARDLRNLDPFLSYPSTILGRERAIVINLEHIKAIISAKEVLVLNARDPAVAPFVEELQRRLRQWSTDGTRNKAEELGLNDTVWIKNVTGEKNSRSQFLSLNYSENDQTAIHKENEDRGDTAAVMSDSHKVLPFEFIALEACLEAACTCLETEVRDELEHLLDDDEDMAEMYLTCKLMRQGLSESSSPDRNDETQLDHGGSDSSSSPTVPLLEVNDASYDLSNVQNEHHHVSLSRVLTGGGHGTNTCSTIGSSKCLDVQDLEMLLEAYFVQIDGTLNTLSALREYVDDTEDYINIMLDDKQNHLLQMGVMLTTATLIVSAFVVLVGIFGMNIQIDLFDEKKSGMTEFLWTIGGGAAGSIFLYLMAVSWCKHRRLLE